MDTHTHAHTVKSLYCDVIVPPAADVYISGSAKRLTLTDVATLLHVTCTPGDLPAGSCRKNLNILPGEPWDPAEDLELCYLQNRRF